MMVCGLVSRFCISNFFGEYPKNKTSTPAYGWSNRGSVRDSSKSRVQSRRYGLDRI